MRFFKQRDQIEIFGCDRRIARHSKKNDTAVLAPLYFPVLPFSRSHFTRRALLTRNITLNSMCKNTRSAFQHLFLRPFDHTRIYSLHQEPVISERWQ
jgi:hypothetical protein